MDTLFLKFQKRKHQLSGLENQVAEYILGNPQQVADMTIDELANRLYISTATISRTAKHLGFKGFQELKFSLEQHVAKQQTAAAVQGHSTQDLIWFKETLQKQFDQTFDGLDTNRLDLAAAAIAKAGMIEVLSVGGSLTLGIDAARKLTALGKLANARIDWDELRSVSRALTADDLAILISLSGETIHIVEYATNLSEKKVPILAVTGSPDSPLAKMATYLFTAPVLPIYFGEADLTSRTALAALLDVLLIHYADIYHH